MNFQKWLDISEKEVKKREARDKKIYGNKRAFNYHDRLIQHFIGYNMFKATKRLVIATILLNLITLSNR